MTLVQAHEPTDAELVRQAMEQKAAFAALYRRYLTPVYRYFYARTGDVQQAEDLTAQTFVAALEGLPRYRERGTFAGRLFTIAARRLADHFRRRRTPPLLDDVTDLPGPDPLPEALAERAEQRARLARALRTLSPDGVSKEWTLITALDAGDGQDLSGGVVSQLSGTGEKDCHRVTYLDALAGRSGTWTLMVTELVGFDLTQPGEQTRLTGPWVFPFVVP